MFVAYLEGIESLVRIWLPFAITARGSGLITNALGVRRTGLFAITSLFYISIIEL